MELIYIWAKMKHGGKFREYNFNFSKEYNIKYSFEEKRISLITKKSQLNIFSDSIGEGGINQVYALIGKNGSGKSTLLRTFLEYDYLKGLGEEFEMVCLFKDGDYKIYTIPNIYDYVKNNNMKIYINIDSKEKKYIAGKYYNKLVPLYYNPYLGNYLPSHDRNMTGDISYERKFSNTVSKNAFSDIWNEDIKRIYTMFNTIKNEEELEELNSIVTSKNKDSFKEIKILLHPVTDESLNFYNLKTSFDSIDKLDFETHYDFKDYNESKDSFIKNLYKKILLGIVYSNSNLKGSYKVKLPEKINFNEITKWIEKIEEMKLSTLMINDNNEQNLNDLSDRINDFKNFKDRINFLNTITFEYFKGTEIKEKTGYHHFDITLEKVLKPDDRWGQFIGLVLKGYIKIETGFSDGEWSMLKLFANIYDELNLKYNRDKSQFLIILDEGDMGFHPEWQRKYLNIMINFFNKIFQHKKINLILASHSPFIASDLPKENVIFMGVDDNQELKTFGANIHELYKESFFMKSTMGDFALSKIKEVIEDLTTLECIQRADRKLKELEKKAEKLKEKGKKLPETEKLKKDKLEESASERVIKKDEIEEKKETIKYIIDQIGERVLSRKLGEKYREIFIEKEEEKIEEKMKNLYRRLSKEEKTALKNEFGDL